jgi:hypothetical protein
LAQNNTRVARRLRLARVGISADLLLCCGPVAMIRIIEAKDPDCSARLRPLDDRRAETLPS